MKNQDLTSRYVQRLNQSLLPHLDFRRLYKSCNSENKDYAGETLKQMHNSFVDIYGTDELDGNHEMVCVPGIIKNQNTGRTALALLDISVEDGGEHFGTQALTMIGALDVHGQEGLTAEITADLFLPYDYWYTVHIPCDHHVNTDVPEDVRALLAYCLPDQPRMEMK